MWCCPSFFSTETIRFEFVLSAERMVFASMLPAEF